MPLDKKKDLDDGEDNQQNGHEKERFSFPYKIVNVDPELNSQLLEDYTGQRTGYVQVGPKQWFFPDVYAEYAEDLYNFEFRKDDVVTITFPRSGTTWTQEMVWLLCNDLNYRKASEIYLWDRFLTLEWDIMIDNDLRQELLTSRPDIPYVPDKDHPVWKTLINLSQRRFIKTHLPFSLLSPNLTKVGCKIICVIRNPKDVAVSYYHLSRSMKFQGFTGDFRKFWIYFEKNLQSWSPYWEHIKEAWNRRHEENVLLIFYEDMVKNLRGSIEKVATFLGKSCTDEEIEILENHLKFENFKTNKSVNYEHVKRFGLLGEKEENFIRRGKTGGWRDYFDKELEQRATEWIENNLKDTDLRFPA